MIFNPLKLYRFSKKLFSQNVQSLNMTIKTLVIFFFVLFVCNSVLEFSHHLVINSRIDTIQHLLSVSNSIKDLTYKNQINLLKDEIVNYKDIIETTIGAFAITDVTNMRTPLLNTLSIAVIPVILILILFLHLIEEIIVKRENQIERVVNIIILMICAFGIFHAMIVFSNTIPTFPEGYIWKNYLINILLTLLLYLVLCGIITQLSKSIVSEPESTAQPDVTLEVKNEAVENV